MTMGHDMGHSMGHRMTDRHALRSALGLAAVMLLSGCPEVDEPGVTLAIENVAVVAMDAPRVLPQQTVLIAGDTIVSVADAGTVSRPWRTPRVDGSGLFLMPGLAEMHARLPGDDRADLQAAALALFVSRGVTFVRGLAGHPGHPELRDAIAAGERFGPTLAVGSPVLSDQLEAPEEARAAVRQYAADGFDLITVGEQLTPATYFPLVEVARELGLPVAGRVPSAVGLLDALRAGQDTVEHLDKYVETLRTLEAPGVVTPVVGAADVLPHVERERIPQLVDATLDARAAVVPTMVLWERLFGPTPVEDYSEAIAETLDLPPELLYAWTSQIEDVRAQIDPERGQALLELRKEILRALHTGGVYILLGSGALEAFNVPGMSLHEEMRYLQDEVGLPPYEVLFSATRAAAEHLGTPEAFGTVIPGRRADLLLVRDNPLEDVGHVAGIEGVVIRGRWFSAEDLQAELYRGAAGNK